MNKILFPCILFSLTLYSCHRREEKAEHNELIQYKSDVIQKPLRDTILFLNTKGEADEKLRRTYAYLIGKDVVVPNTFEEFQAGMNNKNRRENLYKFLKEQNIIVPNTYLEFEKALWPAKEQ